MAARGGLFADVPEPTYAEIHAEAMRFWRERERTLPKFVRRMSPDDLDMVSGVWGIAMMTGRQRLLARRSLGAAPTNPGTDPETSRLTSAA